MKKIIFITGTSHSGSTMLDLMMANRLDAFSVGEVHSLFRPTKNRHKDPICGCGIKNCSSWAGIRDRGEKNLYQNIFKSNPDVDLIVDSSKSLIWIKDQLKYLKKNSEYSVHHLLIWKEPEEIAISLYKRNLLSTWKQIWIKYHLRLFSLVDNPIGVKYSKLAQEPERVMEKICERLGLEYIKGQESYWTKKHHMLFGSAASRIHLHEEDSPEYIRLQNYINRKQTHKKVRLASYRSIQYNKTDLSKLPSGTLNDIRNNGDVNKILKKLTKCDALCDEKKITDDIYHMPMPDTFWHLKLKLKLFFKRISFLYRQG